MHTSVTRKWRAQQGGGGTQCDPRLVHGMRRGKDLGLTAHEKDGLQEQTCRRVGL